MYLNEIAKEMLIDHILEQDRDGYLTDKYAGFEGIVIHLAKNGEVIFPRSSDQEIEAFLQGFDFLQCAGLDHDGTVGTIKYKVDIAVLSTDSGFTKYKNEMLHDAQRELRQLEKDTEEIRTRIGRISMLVG